MTCSRRDSGAIHIMFFISVLIVALAGWGLWYSQYTENEKNVDAAAQAQASDEIAQQELKWVLDAYGDLAKRIGGVPALAAPAGETVDVWQEKFKATHRVVSERRDQEVTFIKGDVSTCPDLSSVFVPFEARVHELESEIDRLKSEISTAASNYAAVNTAKGNADQTLSDTLAAAEAKAQERRATLNTQLTESESGRIKEVEAAEQASTKYDQDLAVKTDEVLVMKNKLEANDREVTILRSRMVTKRAWETPDGNVIEVDHKAGRAWINLGSRDWVRRGTRFKVYGVKKGGVRAHHGYVVVHDIEPHRALCALESGDEMKQGDLIINPHFNRGQKARFFFLGTLPGRYDNQTAQRILESFGGNVDPQMTMHVDFLVLGDNPDPAQVGDDAKPNWFKATTEYTDALRWGVEVIRARDLATYLQY